MAKDSETLEGTPGSQPEGSDKKVSQPSSEQEYVTVEQFNQMMRVVENISRTVQGDKDRAVKKVSQRVDNIESGLKDVLQTAAREGKSLSDLMADVEKQEEEDFRLTMKKVASAFEKGEFPGVKSPGSEKTEGVDVSEVLKELELDLNNDTRVKDFASKKFETKEQALVAGAKLIKNISTHQPTEADLPSGASERAKAAGKQEQLMNEYKEGSKKLFGQALINFKMQMRRRGLEIS